MEASYDFMWKADVDDESVRLLIRGLAPTRREGASKLACISLDSGGRIAVSTTPADKFGLRTLSGVGKGTLVRVLTSRSTDGLSIGIVPFDSMTDSAGEWRRVRPRIQTVVT